MDNILLISLSSIFIIGVTGYFILGICFMGLPHKCIRHGWQSSAVCFDCEDYNENKKD
jgi:hypothetical protein